MKQTQSHYKNHQDMENALGWLSMKKDLVEKVRVNLYLPRIIVRFIDSMAKNLSRGEVVSSLVVEKIKKAKKLPYGMFSGTEISEKEIDEVTSSWDKAISGTV